MWSPHLERRLTLWRHIRRERRSLREALELPLGAVIVYSHPRTASRSIEAAVAQLEGARPFHVHVLQPRHFMWRDFRGVLPDERGIAHDNQPAQWAIHRELLEAGKAVRLVSLVRDPVAVCVSWFFLGLQRWLGYRRRPDPSEIGFDALSEFFYQRFPHDGMLNWFDAEWNATTGLDVFATPFDQERGWQIYQHGPIEALVLSTHLDDAAKAAALSEFLGCSVPAVPRINEGKSRWAPEVYERLQKSVCDHPALVERLLGDRYTRHFFSSEQIAAFHRHWLGS